MEGQGKAAVRQWKVKERQWKGKERQWRVKERQCRAGLGFDRGERALDVFDGGGKRLITVEVIRAI